MFIVLLQLKKNLLRIGDKYCEKHFALFNALTTGNLTKKSHFKLFESCFDHYMAKKN